MAVAPIPTSEVTSTIDAIQHLPAGAFFDLPEGILDPLQCCFYTMPHESKSFMIHRLPKDNPNDDWHLVVSSATFDADQRPTFEIYHYVYEPIQNQFVCVTMGDLDKRANSYENLDEMIRWFQSQGYAYLPPEQTTKINHCFQQLLSPSWFIQNHQPAIDELDEAPPGTYFVGTIPDLSERFWLFFKSEDGVIQSRFIRISPDGLIVFYTDQNEEFLCSEFSQLIEYLNLRQSLSQYSALESQHSKYTQRRYQEFTNLNWFVNAQNVESAIADLQLSPEGTFFTCSREGNLYIVFQKEQVYKMPVTVCEGRFEILNEDGTRKALSNFSELKNALHLNRSFSKRQSSPHNQR